MSFHEEALARQQAAEAKLDAYKADGERIAREVTTGIRESLGWKESDFEILAVHEGKPISKTVALTDDGRIAFAFQPVVGGMQRPFHFLVYRERGTHAWTLKHAETSWPLDLQRMGESLAPVVEHVKGVIQGAIAEFYFTDRT